MHWALILLIVLASLLTLLFILGCAYGAWINTTAASKRLYKDFADRARRQTATGTRRYRRLAKIRN